MFLAHHPVSLAYAATSGRWINHIHASLVVVARDVCPAFSSHDTQTLPPPPPLRIGRTWFLFAGHLLNLECEDNTPFVTPGAFG